MQPSPRTGRSAEVCGVTTLPPGATAWASRPGTRNCAFRAPSTPQTADMLWLRTSFRESPFRNHRTTSHRTPTVERNAQLRNALPENRTTTVGVTCPATQATHPATESDDKDATRPRQPKTSKPSGRREPSPTGWSSIPLLRRGGSREGTDGVVLQFPSLGGVAVAKRLTGWSVTFPHTPRKPPRRSAATPPKEGNMRWSIPLLRRGGRPEGPDGVVGHLPAHLKKTTPALRATPPKEGNF